MKRLIIIAVVILVLAGLGFRLSQELERYTYTDEKGYSRRAFNDRFLALRRWTMMNGITLDDDLGAGLEEFDAVILNCNILADPDFAETLSAWIESGGRLTVLLAHDWEPEVDFTPVIDFAAEFGLEMTVDYLYEAQWAMPEGFRLQGKGGGERTVTVSQGTRIFIDTIPKGSMFIPAEIDDVADDAVDAALDAEADVDVDANAEKKNNNGYYFLSVPAGEGRLTLTGSPIFMENQNIGKADNASLVWDLLSGDATSGNVLFLPDAASVKSLADKPWTIAVLACLASSLLLGAWTALVRRDALLDAERPAGSDIGRRLAAEGNFFRSRGCTEGYLAACRTDALRRLRRRGLADKEGLIDTDAVSRRLKADPALLADAFNEKSTPGKKDFRKIMKLFHHIKEVI